MTHDSSWADGPLSALARKSAGDPRLLLDAFFSFLHRRTDFYVINGEDAIDIHDGGDSSKNQPQPQPQPQSHLQPQPQPQMQSQPQNKQPQTMGFRQGDAENMILASFRQFPLHRIKARGGRESIKEDNDTGTKDTKGGRKKEERNDEDRKEEGVKEELGTESVTKVEVTDGCLNTGRNSSHSGTDVTYTTEGKQVPNDGNGGTFHYRRRHRPFDSTTDTSPGRGKEGMDSSTVVGDANDDDNGDGNGNDNGDDIDEGAGLLKVRWTQTRKEVSVAFPLPRTGTKGKDLDIVMRSGYVNVIDCLEKGEKRALIEGEFAGPIHPDESTWTVEGEEGSVLVLSLEKVSNSWWDHVLHSAEGKITNSTFDDKIGKTTEAAIIDTSIIAPRKNLHKYDEATQGMIRKIVSEQRQRDYCSIE